MTGMSPSLCDRTRALLSERLDGAISEVERRRVARHTSTCPACRAFEERPLAGGRDAGRAARGAPPTRRRLPSRARRLSSRTLGNAASAAALLVVVVGGFVVGTDGGGPNAPGSRRRRRVRLSDPLRALRVDALRAGELPILPETGPEPAVKPARPVDG